MPPKTLLSRRGALKRAALSVLALPLLNAPAALRAAVATSAAPSPANRDRTRGIKLGVASISLQSLPIEAVASALKQLEIGYVSIFRTHAAFEKGTPEECRAAAAAFRAAGIAVATTSVVNLLNDEALLRKAFENVKAAGLSLMTCRPVPAAMPLIERFVKEYDIRLAIHNHGPEDKDFPGPDETLKLIQPYDARIGLCLDVGHAMRAKADVPAAVRRCAARLYDVHLKDSLSLPGSVTDIPTEVGRGQMDIRGILAALVDIKYSGVVAFEYERVGVNPLIGLSESVGYVRGVLASLPG
ncbi:MAG: sugar phosphate isomerase/epimerase [Opitutaceae bacterium]